MRKITIFHYIAFGMLIVAPAALVESVIILGFHKYEQVILVTIEGALLGAVIIGLAKIILGDRPNILLRIAAFGSALIPLNRPILFYTYEVPFADETFFELLLGVVISLSIANFILKKLLEKDDRQKSIASEKSGRVVGRVARSEVIRRACLKHR